MGMGPAGVFILESPGIDEIAGGYAEAPVVIEMLKLLGIPCVSRRVECRSELETSGRIFQQRPFDVLLISAHGAPGLIELTNGDVVSASEILDLFSPKPETTVLFSSCEVLAGDSWVKTLARPNLPNYILGYETKIYWSRAALASTMLMNALCFNDFGSIVSTLVAIHQCAQSSICGFVSVGKDPKYEWFSTEAFIEEAKTKTGADSDLELSVLISEYMRKEREAFERRTEEYMEQIKEIKQLNSGDTEEISKSIDEAYEAVVRPDSVKYK